MSTHCGPTNYQNVAEWVNAARGHIPSHAVQGGYDGRDTIYVGRVYHQGDVIPGKIQPSHGCCYVPWGGNEHAHHDYQVLVNRHGSVMEWHSASNGTVPPGAIQGGRTNSGEPLFIGRVHQNGSVTVGKVQPSHGVLYVSYGGKEIPHRSYEVLIVKTVALR
ncbi:natterin-3-like [Tachypleus tridentatus]|uniref:natterin-3-like n=1 Tax=Tachypleus tridentatus TaxID=6853 RepID=UPI003FD57BC2